MLRLFTPKEAEGRKSSLSENKEAKKLYSLRALIP
jgi:hypothetical protein